MKPLIIILTLALASFSFTAEWERCEQVGVLLNENVPPIAHVLFAAAPRTALVEVMSHLESDFWLPDRIFSTAHIEPGSSIGIVRRGHEIGGLWIGAEYVCFYRLVSDG